MSHALRRTVVLVGVLVLGCGQLALGQDWPQWRGVARDGKAAGFQAPETWPTELSKQWSTEVGLGDATPALVDERLFVFSRQGDQEVILCLDAKTGKPLWRTEYAAPPVTGPASRHAGPRSSPAVAEGKVVTLGATGIVSCVNASNGKLLWRKDPYPGLVPTFFTASSPLIINGTAVVQVGGRGKGAIVAFDLATGDERWRWEGPGPEYASPVVLTAGDSQQVVALTEKSLVGVSADDGSLLWEMPFPSERRAYNSATPIVDGQTVIYMGARRGMKAVKIVKRGDGFAAEELWTATEPAPQFNTPVLKDGFLYGLSDRGKLFCVSARDGRTAWIDSAQRDRGFGSVVDVGPCLLALSSSSELLVFQPDSEQFRQLASIKVADTSTYAHPVPSGNRIFIKDESHLTLWTVD